MKALVTTMAAGTAVLLVACGGGEITEAAARTKAQEIVSEGKPVAAERETTGTEDVWKVSMSMPGGGELVVELEAEDGELEEIEAEKGPWDYDVAPRPDVIKYSVARSKALETRTGTIEAWEFKNESNIWEFYIRTADQLLFEIKMNATDGAVTSTEEKAARD